MRLLATLLLLLVAGCASTPPVVRIAAPPAMRIGPGAAGTDRFVVALGKDLLRIGPDGDTLEKDALANVRGTVAALSQDGSVVASLSAEGAAVVRLASGAERVLASTKVAGPSAPYGDRGVAIAPDGSLVAIGSNGALELFSLPDFMPKKSFPIAGTCSSVALDPRGNRVACTIAREKTGELIVFDLASGERLVHDATLKWPAPAAFSNDGNSVASFPMGRLLIYFLTRPGEKFLRDLEDSPALDRLRDRNSSSHGFAIANDGSVYVGRRDASVALVRAGKVAAVFPVLAAVDWLLLSRDERWLLVAGSGTLALLDAATGKIVRPLFLPRSEIERVELEGPHVRLFHRLGAACVHDRSGALVRVEPRLVAWREEPPATATSPDQKLEALSEGSDVRVRDRATGSDAWRLSGGSLARALAFSPDSSTLAVATNDGALRLFDARTGRVLRTLCGVNEPESSVTSLAFSSDGRELACGGLDGSARVYSLAD